MSYAGLGLLLGGGMAPIGLTVSGPTTTSAPALVNVGIPPALVKLYGTWLWNLGASMGMSDTTARPLFIIVGGALKTPRLNTFGLVDPASVAKTLSQLPANLRAFADNAASAAPYGPKIVPFLADITAGKYAGQAPSLTMRSPLLAAAAPRLAMATLNAQQAAIMKTSADIQKAAADKAVADAQTLQDAQAAAVAKAQADQTATVAAVAKAQADAVLAQTQQQVLDPSQAYPLPPADLSQLQVTPTVPGATPGDGYVDASAPPPQPDSYTQPATPALPAPTPPSPGPFGVSWKIWAVGAAVAAGGYLVMNSKMMSANRRRRVRRNRRRTR